MERSYYETRYACSNRTFMELKYGHAGSGYRLRLF